MILMMDNQILRNFQDHFHFSKQHMLFLDLLTLSIKFNITLMDLYHSYQHDALQVLI